ncbi:Type-1 restriction enzyme EcoKI specificity protein [anaerobic digester metagenome]
MQQKSELPEGWKSVSLGELVQPSKEKIEPSENPNLKYVGLEHIESHKCQIKGYGFSVDIKSTKTMFHRGDVLYGKLRPYLNKVCVPNFDGVCSTDILVFNATSNLNNYYLMRFLSTPNVVDYASNNSSGVQLPRINFQKLSSYTVPLPPLSEQHRIVSAIEALFARLDATNEKLDRVPGILKKFRQSVLAAACDGRLTEDWRKANPDIESAKELVKSIIHEKETKSEKRKVSLNSDLEESVVQNIPESWFESSLDKISIKITDGTHHSPPNGAEGDFKYITAKNIKNDGIDLKNVTYVSSEVHDEIYSRCNPEYGDLLLIKDGATTGIVTLNNLTEPFSMLSSVALLKFPEGISNKYIMYYMRSPDFQSNVQDKMGGAAITRLTLKKISNMIVALPPLPEQHEIVRRVDALFAFADSIESKVAAAREKTEKLRQSILAKAFSGELVETEAEIARREGRDYEKAEVLIERIKKERRVGMGQ